MKKLNYQKFIFALIIPQVAGLLGTTATIPNLDSWYKNLIKPDFNPPGWIFGPVWTVLFLLMGISFYLVWTREGGPNKLNAYVYFFLQLCANVLWSYLFFATRNPQLAFAEIILLLLLIVGNIFYFYKINKTAAYLLIPYVLWVCFAAVLNYFIAILN